MGTLTDAAHDAFIGDGRHEVGVLLGARVALRPEHTVGVLGGMGGGVKAGAPIPSNAVPTPSHPRAHRLAPHSPGLYSWPPSPSAPAPSPAPRPWRGRLRDSAVRAAAARARASIQTQPPIHPPVPPPVLTGRGEVPDGRSPSGGGGQKPQRRAHPQ